MMYHVICGLESRFGSLSEAKRYVATGPALVPEIPHTAMPFEDRTVPRICLAPTVEDCVTAIGVLGMFRRCLNADPDAKSYENEGEAYPVIVCGFPDDIPGNPYVDPSEAQVPDVRLTGEKWLLRPAVPVMAELRWLNQYSLRIDTDAERTVCTNVKFVENLDGFRHPWLDGRGHPLDCSDMGGDVWPDNVTKSVFSPEALKFLYRDASTMDGYVYPVPVSNCRIECHVVRHGADGLVMTGETYMTSPSRLKTYSGFMDVTGRLMFDEDLVYLYGPNGSTDSCHLSYEDGTWLVRPFGKPSDVKTLRELASTYPGRILECLKLVSPDGRQPMDPPVTESK